jgi:hypothetical protein
MGKRASHRLNSDVIVLPDDIMHIVLSRLEFRDKVNAGAVCKHWEQLLQSGTAVSRHWVVDYNIDRVVSSEALTARDQGHATNGPTNAIGRCVNMLNSLITQGLSEAVESLCCDSPDPGTTVTDVHCSHDVRPMISEHGVHRTHHAQRVKALRCYHLRTVA